MLFRITYTRKMEVVLMKVFNINDKYYDKLFPSWGIGVCIKILKTRVHIEFPHVGLKIYDKNHYKFLVKYERT